MVWLTHSRGWKCPDSFLWPHQVFHLHLWRRPRSCGQYLALGGMTLLPLCNSDHLKRRKPSKQELIDMGLLVPNTRMRSRQEGQPSNSSSISTDWLETAFDRLVGQGGIRQSTRNKYHKIHNRLNSFCENLTRKPDNWADKVHLYFTYLMVTGAKSNTLATYKSAIKKILTSDGCQVQLNTVALASIIKACKYKNDEVIHRLPIDHSMLITLINTLERYFDQQPYLLILYKAMFSAAYHGLLRIGEMTNSEHAILARDVLVARNRRKIQFLLRSSKTHGLGDPPQIISVHCDCWPQGEPKYCPYEILYEYNITKDNYSCDSDQYFVFRGNIPVETNEFRKLLKRVLTWANIACDDFSAHSFCIGHAHDMERRGEDVSVIKAKGRWKSSVFYAYLKYNDKRNVKNNRR